MFWFKFKKIVVILKKTMCRIRKTAKTIQRKFKGKSIFLRMSAKYHEWDNVSKLHSTICLSNPELGHDSPCVAADVWATARGLSIRVITAARD
jgi:hypothetical protein